MICWSGTLSLFFIQFLGLSFRTCPAMFFNSSMILFPDFLESTFSMTSVTSTDLQLKLVCVTSFLLLGQLRDLPHSKQ